MKIGIVTFWYSNENYGQILQGYALQAHLKKLGHDAYIVKYDKSKEGKNKKATRSSLLKSAVKKLFPTLLLKGKKPSLVDERRFVLFKQKNISFSPSTYNSYAELVANPPEADIYISGSDQVWNYAFVGKREPFFLKFGSKSVIRLSYSASFGQTEIPLELKQEYTSLLKNLDGVSVREDSGVKLCKSMGCSSAKLLPDPTFLLSRVEWRAMMETDSTFESTKEKKVFVYTLGNRPLEAKEKVLSLIKENDKYSVAHVSINKDMSGNCVPTINQWLTLINNCDYVVTNSFHGLAFSIILNKNFIVLPSEGSTIGMNERITSLLSKLDLEEHIMYQFSDENFRLLEKKEIDWERVNLIIEKWKNESDEFLNFENYKSKNGL